MKEGMARVLPTVPNASSQSHEGRELPLLHRSCPIFHPNFSLYSNVALWGKRDPSPVHSLSLFGTCPANCLRCKQAWCHASTQNAARNCCPLFKGTHSTTCSLGHFWACSSPCVWRNEYTKAWDCASLKQHGLVLH